VAFSSLKNFGMTPGVVRIIPKVFKRLMDEISLRVFIARRAECFRQKGGGLKKEVKQATSDYKTV